MSTAYGILFSHASAQVYEDLIGPSFDTASARDETMFRVLRAQGVKGLRVLRRPGQEWTDQQGRSAREALSDGIANNFRGWL